LSYASISLKKPCNGGSSTRLRLRGNPACPLEKYNTRRRAFQSAQDALRGTASPEAKPSFQKRDRPSKS